MKYRENTKGQPLSQKELDIINLVAKGFTSKEIGKTLNKSWETIRGQLNSINHKLDTKTRTGAVIKSIQLGLIKVDEVIVQNRN